MKTHFYCDSTEKVRNEERGHSPQKTHRECSQSIVSLTTSEAAYASTWLLIHHIHRMFTVHQSLYYNSHESNQAIYDI